MSPLIQAVRDVRTELQAGETLDDAVAFVAEEQGLNPALLRRKVQESHADHMGDLPKATVVQRHAEPARRRPRNPERALDNLIRQLVEMDPDGAPELYAIVRRVRHG